MENEPNKTLNEHRYELFLLLHTLDVTGCGKSTAPVFAPQFVRVDDSAVLFHSEIMVSRLNENFI